MRQVYDVPEPGEPFDPAVYKLGLPCKRNHFWHQGVTLRKVKGGYCILCNRIDCLERQRLLRQDPDYNRKAAASIAEKRKREGRASRSKHGLRYTPRDDHEARAMHAAIKLAGRLPCVAQLVYSQQLQYWKDHPDEHLIYVRTRKKHYNQLRYMIDISYRLYHRSKSKARKVAQRGGTPTPLSPTHLWRHWCRFDNRCAYCGCADDLEVEHVIPICKGGEHHLGNIVPACHACNSNKGRKDALHWFKTRSYYSEARWQRIQLILKKLCPITDQLVLLV